MSQAMTGKSLERKVEVTDTSATPLGRVGQPADLLGALAFLVSDESSFVTGQTLLVNGGRLVR